MDQNLPIIAKKFWKIVRVAFFMLRKGLSKRKLMFDLNLFFKRGKIASKAAIHNLMFHHHDKSLSVPNIYINNHEYYEFSCSNSPAFHLPFNLNKRNKHSHKFPRAHANETNDDDVVMINSAVMKALEMVKSETTSPILPGFGMTTPMVRQLRITDSPFPLRDVEGDISHVDEDAEEFISKFYRDLRRETKAFG